MCRTIARRGRTACMRASTWCTTATDGRWSTTSSSSPAADPSRIRLSYQGAESLRTDAQGNLLIATRLGTLIQRKPLVYQEWNGERHEIEASYSVHGGGVEFAIARWDRQRELVIDPVLVLDYSTYLGGTGFDLGYGIAVDATGAAYVTGVTDSTNFPVMNPVQGNGGGKDAYVTKRGRRRNGRTSILDARNQNRSFTAS
jgi:Beta-propeller repeat